MAGADSFVMWYRSDTRSKKYPKSGQESKR
jgi:hypothetical protein